MLLYGRDDRQDFHFVQKEESSKSVNGRGQPQVFTGHGRPMNFYETHGCN